MNKLNCFVASAFGHKDIDKIYSKAIVPVLRELKIMPRRVDRINHNNKIDHKIIELINECNFGIADLTQARPSVYYEAGFIEGLNKNVIYICREDHFKPQAQDTFGNQKIHFDLITKNIIPWNTPSDGFRRKLKSRILLLTKHLLISSQKSTEEIKSKSEFANYSINEKLTLLSDIVKAHLETQGFKEITLRHHHNVFQKGKKRVYFNVELSFPENELNILTARNGQLSEYEKYRLNQLFISLKPLPYARMERVLRNFKPLKGNLFTFKDIKVYFIDSLDSVYKLENYLKTISFK
jgi:hypothetical protein